jgi:tRNA A37 threonylcarbamoyltransferase TsaD
MREAPDARALPELALCTDNGAHDRAAAAMRWQRGLAQPQADYAFNVRAALVRYQAACRPLTRR